MNSNENKSGCGRVMSSFSGTAEGSYDLIDENGSRYGYFERYSLADRGYLAWVEKREAVGAIVGFPSRGGFLIWSSTSQSFSCTLYDHAAAS